MVLTVQLKGLWLVDVGYGNGFIEPLSLDESGIQEQGYRTFRCLYEEGKFIVQESCSGIWVPWYIFTRTTKTVEDFEVRNQFHQTNRESIFFGKRICMIPKKDGEMVELLGNILIRTTPSGVRRTAIQEKDIPELLQAEFGIV